MLEAAQLDELHRFRDLRHTFADMHGRGRCPDADAAGVDGARDLATTQIYADYAPPRRLRWSRRRSHRLKTAPGARVAA